MARRFRRAVIVAAAAAMMLTLIPAETGARTIYTRRHTFKAAVPCGALCAYWWEGSDIDGLVPGVRFQACRYPFPPGSWADKVVRAPSGADLMVFKAYPSVDWDIFVCSKPARGNNGSQIASGANFATECQIACVEAISLKVVPGRYYVLRAYNWSDPRNLPARYSFLDIR